MNYHFKVNMKGEKMYRFKKELFMNIKINQKNLANEIGLSRQYINGVINNKYNCRKIVAYAMTKLINSDAEISDYFEMV